MFVAIVTGAPCGVPMDPPRAPSARSSRNGDLALRPTHQEYGVKPEVAAELEASDLALNAFSSGTSTHFRVCESTGAPRTLRGRSTAIHNKV